MDAFIDSAKALAHPGIDAGACSTNYVHPDDVGFD